MGNTFNGATLVWKVDSTGSLTTDAATFKRPKISKIVYIPSAAADDLVFQDSGSVNAIVLKAGASDASPIHLDFGEKGRYIAGLKCSTIDGGTAYVYLA